MRSFRILLGITFLTLSGSPLQATVNDSLSFAHEAAAPYAKRGYTIREDAWGGDLGVKDQKAVTAQLFRGNDYYFWLASDVKNAVLSVHIYDSSGRLVEKESKSEGRFAYARIEPPRTGTYYIIVTVAKSPRERTNWALVYGFK